MVDKCSSPTPKMTVLDCLKPSTLSAVGNDDRMSRNNMGLINKVDMVCLSPVGYGV